MGWSGSCGRGSDGSDVSFHGMHGFILIAQRLPQRIPVTGHGCCSGLHLRKRLAQTFQLLHAQLQLRLRLLHAVTRRICARDGEVLLERGGGGGALGCLETLTGRARGRVRGIVEGGCNAYLQQRSDDSVFGDGRRKG